MCACKTQQKERLMKRVFQILFGYLLFCCCVCTVVGAFIVKLPDLLPSSVRMYRLFAGLQLFLKVLPAVVITGYVVGFAVSFGRNPEGSTMRFSPAMFVRYRRVMISAIVCAFILTVGAEVGTPLLGSMRLQMEQMPRLEREYIRIGNEMLGSGRADMAYAYAELAVKLDSKSGDAKKLMASAEKAKEAYDLKKASADGDAVKLSEEGYTVHELRLLADEAFAERRWFDAHYYAETGVSIASPKDSNLESLKRTAAEAWNQLSQAELKPMTAEEKIFARKKDGYSALMDGDNLKAYYIFRTLSLESHALSIDADIVRYLGIAEKRVENESFFIDETFNMKGFETASNVSFSLKHRDGSTDIVNVKGITPVKDSGGMVQYLRGLSIVSVDDRGKFVRSMYAAYAKMLNVPAAEFDSQVRDEAGAEDETVTIPYVLLRSVDRDTEGVVNEPLYTYADPEKSGGGESFIMPIPSDDFEMLCDASKGAELMNVTLLFRFIPKAMQFGYSEEVFAQVMLGRLLYPLFLVILFVFFAVFAWNYRIGETLMFRLVWILIFPVITFVSWFISQAAQWVYQLLGYVFVGVAGSRMALLLGCGVYTGVLILVSILFLSRNGIDEA